MPRTESPGDPDRCRDGDGHGAAVPERFAPTRVAPADPVAAAIRATLAEGRHWLRVNTPKARARDPDGVHDLRTTTRRLRGALALFRDLTDPDWADRLAEECKWLAGQLGSVRDLDVLADRLHAEADSVLEDAPEALAPLFDDLRARHAEASEALGQALCGERFAALEADLAEAAAHPPLSKAAGRPCRSALPPLVRDVWTSLKRGGRALEPDDPDEAFHQVRKAAKRARYAAEAVRAALDSDDARAAARFARRARAVQDILGAHQDAVVAASEIQRAAAAHPDNGPFNFAAGRLVERESATARHARARFFKTWRDLDRKKVVRWLKR